MKKEEKLRRETIASGNDRSLSTSAKLVRVGSSWRFSNIPGAAHSSLSLKMQPKSLADGGP